MTRIFETYVNAIRWLDNANIGTTTISVDGDMSWFCLKTSSASSLFLLRPNSKYAMSSKDIILWAKNLNLDYRYLTEDEISIFIFEYLVK